MDTRSDNLTKIPAATKPRKPSNRDLGLKRKVSSAVLERQSVSVLKKRDIPPLTPLHRLQRFKAIRDKNLKSKGSKTSLDNKTKTMEEVTTATITTVDIKEKVVIKETVEEVEVSNTNGIEKSEENVIGLENGCSIENGHNEGTTSSKDEQRRSVRLKENKFEDIEIEEKPKEEKKNEDSNTNTLTINEPVQDINFEPQAEEGSKAYSESVGESDAVSSAGSQQAVASSSPAPTDDEEEVEIIESKSEYESNSQQKESDSIKREEKVAAIETSLSAKAGTSTRYQSSSSIASSYRSSYGSTNSGPRIYGRRPVRYHAVSRKRKMEEESVKNNDFKRTNSPSVPSPRWRFIPSAVNFWTPRTTPFAFSISTPVQNLNDSMAVNIDEDTIHGTMDDSDLFSDADEFLPQPPKKSRWGCSIM